MTNFETTSPMEKNYTVENSSASSSPNMLLTLKVIEYLFLAASVGTFVIIKVFPDIPVARIYVAGFFASWIFFLLANRQLAQNANASATQSELTKKAELYPSLTSNNSVGNNSINSARVKALQYSQELIDDYKRTRTSSRNIYYAAQLATVVFSGVTPILVLVDKLEAGVSWLKWLPVICPAIASIVASIVTSFPFQENWIAANTSVELLEAEQEKFVLGVSEPYRYNDVTDETQRQKQAQMAIENFITQVNNIHLKLVQESGVKKSAEQKTETSEEKTAAT
ncbi:DUF4231 domain-containing protein [Iningainema tapete]|uniref:DUF4231 domain-containing protein n=1 Tax=Iningainema tapete BLCC-T55 TaxID=2748662 RepID=A0A8J6XTY5_9CYAN|nr:DUF4231 domain-containing protein [Iningainema tapete]MBD2773848.1 DUF4231 domain-containing protein [Iningainema tapete BLCC-T55]